MAKSYSVLVWICILFTGCDFENNGPATAGPARCVAPSCPPDHGNREISRSCSLATEGVILEQGKTYFRVDRNIQNPTFCTYTRADDLSPRCHLTAVCADVVPPSDWRESTPIRDEAACDHPTDPAVNNVKVVTKCFHLVLRPGDDTTPVVALPDATKDISYTQNFSISDNIPNDCDKPGYLFRLTQGSLPSGMGLNEQTSTLSGIPSISGQTYSFTVVGIANDTGCTGSRKYTLKVN